MSVTSLSDYRQRQGYRIVISPGLWRGFDVMVEPATATHPLRHAKTYAEAMALAMTIQRAEGWPLFSCTGDDTPPGPKAA